MMGWIQLSRFQLLLRSGKGRSDGTGNEVELQTGSFHAVPHRDATEHTGQPTVIVYRTVKGWGYGIKGRASHGAGHKLCSDGFYQALAEGIAIRGGWAPVAVGSCCCSCHPPRQSWRPCSPPVG